MPAPASTLSHGDTGFRIRADFPRRRAQSLHELEQSWCMDSLTDYTVGDAPPDYPKMRIVDIEPLDTYDGGSVALRLLCEGILGDEDYLILSQRERQPEEGWDVVDLVVATLTPDEPRWLKGARLQTEEGIPLADYQNLWLVDRDMDHHRAAGFKILALSFKGLKGSKPYKRRINGNVVTSVSRFDGYTVLTGDRYQNFPPTDSGTNDSIAGDSIEIEYDAASLTVSDTYITTTEPPTQYIGQPWTPPDAPDVTVLVLVGEATKYFWPFGWYCNSMPCEKLAVDGQDAWIVTVNYAFRVASIPVTA